MRACLTYSKKRQCAAEVPHGEYEVKIEKMELIPTKRTNKPMVSVWFKIVAGDYKNSMIYMNQVITEGFQIHIMNEFLKSLGTDVNVEFKTYKQYGNMIMDIKEALDESGVEFALDYGETSRDIAIQNHARGIKGQLPRDILIPLWDIIAP